jgi:hypothetical protein
MNLPTPKQWEVLVLRPSMIAVQRHRVTETGLLFLFGSLAQGGPCGSFRSLASASAPQNFTCRRSCLRTRLFAIFQDSLQMLLVDCDVHLHISTLIDPSSRRRIYRRTFPSFFVKNFSSLFRRVPTCSLISDRMPFVSTCKHETYRLDGRKP